MKANKDLSQLQTVPDASEEVKREKSESNDIHVTFSVQGKESKERERKVKVNKDLIQLQAVPEVSVQVKREKSESIHNHDAFSVQEKESEERDAR